MQVYIVFVGEYEERCPVYVTVNEADAHVMSREQNALAHPEYEHSWHRRGFYGPYQYTDVQAFELEGY